jgi:hypothetical protein
MALVSHHALDDGGGWAMEVSRGELSMAREVEHVVAKATHQDSRIVTIGGLLFFSTYGGDAWVLDPEERRAEGGR